MDRRGMLCYVMNIKSTFLELFLRELLRFSSKLFWDIPNEKARISKLNCFNPLVEDHISCQSICVQPHTNFSSTPISFLKFIFQKTDGWTVRWKIQFISPQRHGNFIQRHISVNWPKFRVYPILFVKITQ